MKPPPGSTSLPANRSMPTATVIPVLGYPDVRAAVDWLGRAFGFVERLQIGGHRAQLTFNGGAVVVTGQPPGSPAPAGHSIMVRVADANRHCEQARKSGANILHPPADFPYGERQYTAIDPAGHCWTFSQTIVDREPSTWGGVLRPEGPATPRDPSSGDDPTTVVQRQLDAYNAKDVTTLLATYADDAELYEHPATLLAKGSAALRERFEARFQEPNLHAELLSRIVQENLVIDHEQVTRTFPEGPGSVELIMIYEVKHGRIARAWTRVGPKTVA